MLVKKNHILNCKPSHTVKPLIAASLCAFFMMTAQAAAFVTPDAGTILRLIQENAPPSHSSIKTNLTIEQSGGVKQQSGAPFMGNSIKSTGDEKNDMATIHALVAEGEGKSLTPDAETILRLIQPNTPPSHSSIKTNLTIEQSGGVKQQSGASFMVNSFKITGDEKNDMTTIHALVAEGEGKSLTLVQLNKLAARITDYYQSHGYPLTRAIIPAQVIRSGVVHVQIIMAYSGMVNLDNSSPVKDSLLHDVPAPLQSGQAVGQAELDKANLTVEQSGGVKQQSGASFMVNSIKITGDEKNDMTTIHALVAEGEGKSLTLVQLNKLVARITDYYQNHGYPLTRAIIPAQVIRSGIVHVQIIMAYYGKVNLDNSSRVNDSLLHDVLAPLQSGQAVGQAELDQTLLLLSDIPGIATSAILKPGEAVGTSDLLVNVAHASTMLGNVSLDNYGNRYTGIARIVATFNYMNPLHHGDVVSLSVISSGQNTNYGRLSYDYLLNGKGTHIGGSYSALYYRLGGSLESLKADGTAQVADLWVKHPLIRTRDFNLYGQIQYERLQLNDHVNEKATRTDRHLDSSIVSLVGDARDTLLVGGVTTFNMSWTRGYVGFDDETAQLSDATTAKTKGGFSKWNANLARMQYLSMSTMIYISLSGQWANSNLDSSQKMIFGGPSTVRAYDVGVISGDIGYLGTAEIRQDLGTALYGQWQAVAFIDSGYVTVNKSVWAGGANNALLSGAGVGLNWAGRGYWSAKASVATPITERPSLLGSTDMIRVWAEISSRF